MSKISNILILGMFLFFVSFASAKVSFIGTVYEDSTPINELSNVDVRVICNESASNIVKTDASGAYAIPLDSCADGDSLKYELSLSNYESTSRGSISGSYVGQYDESNVVSLSTGDIYVTDFILSKKKSSSSSSGGGSGGSCSERVWTCDSNWSECNGASQTRNCVSNCRKKKVETQSCVVGASGVNLDRNEVSFENEEPSVVKGVGFFSAITGAVIGGGATSIAMSVFLLLVIITVIVLIKKKKK